MAPSSPLPSSGLGSPAQVSPTAAIPTTPAALLPFSKRFEDAAFAVAQALSPHCKLKREDVPFDDFRQILSEVYEKKGLASVIAPVKLPLSPSMEGDIGEPSSITSRTYSQDSSSGTVAAPPTTGQSQQSQRVRQLQETRALRRKASQTERVEQFDCDEESLPSAFSSSYESLLLEEIPAMQRYHIIINSLKNFFFSRPQESKQNAVEKACAEFIRKHIITTNKELARKYDGSPSKEDKKSALARGVNVRLRETEISILLQLYSIQHFPLKLEQTTLPEKLRYIFVEESAQKLRRFLEEEICDNFAHFIPSFLISLFDDFGMEPPVDLCSSSACKEEEEESEFNVDCCLGSRSKSTKSTASKKSEKPASPTRTSALSLSSRLAALLEEDNPPGPSTSCSQSQKSLARKRKSLPTQDEKTPIKRRRTYVPETPEEKLQRGREKTAELSESKEKELREVVQQTPMEKLARVPDSRRGAKIAALNKAAFLSDMNSPASSKGSPTLALRRSLRNPIPDLLEKHKNSSPMTRSLLLSSSSPDTPTRRTSTRVIHAQQLASGSKSQPVAKSLNTQSSKSLSSQPAKSSGIRTAKAPFSQTTPPKKQSTAHSSSVKSSTTLFDIKSPTARKYKDRMEEVQLEGSQDDPSAVFYGRMSNRVGLFNEDEEKGPLTTVSYSRTGRMVYNPGCVFVAHTLLNSHNHRPLSHTRPTTAKALFKLGRMVKIASKNDRRKLNRLCLRAAKGSSKKKAVKPVAVSAPPDPPAED